MCQRLPVPSGRYTKLGQPQQLPRHYQNEFSGGKSKNKLNGLKDKDKLNNQDYRKCGIRRRQEYRFALTAWTSLA
jgi:hypothetical protein